MSRPKQIRASSLSAPQIRFEERVLRGAFLKIAAALPCRPAPRTAWDNRARADNPVSHPAHDALLLCRGALVAAIATGNAASVRDTRLAIESYFEQVAHAAVTVDGAAHSASAGITACSTECSATDVVSDECASVAAIVSASEAPSPGALDVACDRSRRAADAIANYLRTAHAKARFVARATAGAATSHRQWS